ncbi:MAG: ABC transporter ATP-binding protein [Clostridiales bacterium]|nr:ABC transporter ATP-binding protein [Clostridiales bacterium]
MEKLFDYMDIHDDSAEGNRPVPQTFGEIKFHIRSFSYPSSESPVLQAIDFNVKRGERIAIVGENGAGKSTLVKLLLRLYPLEPGAICFDDKPISEMDILSYRKQFAAIFQDFGEFDLTLKENVVISDLRQEDEKRVLISFAQAGIDLREWKMEPEQMLGKRFETGRDLSGGQWQRVALARAFYSDADILVLDEPTAALDSRMEKFVFNKFYELAHERTVFFITHRLATVRKADRILVLKNGRICGFDSHENLLLTNPYYSELYHMQADLYE